MTETRIEKINAFLRVLEKFDFAGAQAMCTEKAVVWQNDSTVEQPIAERMEQFAAFVTNLRSLRYDAYRQFEHADEVLQQHVLHLDLNDGTRQEINALLYFRFEGDLIDRIEEYHYSMPTD